MFNEHNRCKNEKSHWLKTSWFSIFSKNVKSSKFFYTNLFTKKKIVFRNLQTIFVFFIFLIHFDKKRRLYIDLNAFKQWKFAIIVYHVLDDSFDDDFYSRTFIQFIMFLNRFLKKTKKNYWSTKLKVVDIVWIMRKIRHMIESTKIFFVIMYIDHFATVFIFRQITLITFNSNKLNLRLIKTSKYLFNLNLFIRHKIDKTNVMFDVFFRFQVDASIIEKIDVLKSFYDHFLKSMQRNLISKTLLLYHHVTLIEMSNDFKRRFKQIYQNDKHWIKIFEMIQFKKRIAIEIAEVKTSSTIEIAEIKTSSIEISTSSAIDVVEINTSSTTKTVEFTEIVISVE